MLSSGQGLYEFSCGHDGEFSSDPATTSYNDLDFNYNSGCEPLTVNVRFVFLTRDDGFGSFDPNSSMIQEWVAQSNRAWNSITDNDACEPAQDYPTNANVKISLQGVHTIANTDAWNFRAAANALPNYRLGSFCPSGIDDGNWPALKTEVDNFNAQYPNSINFFFVEDGDHLNYLKNAVDNGIQLSEPWNLTGNIPIFTGCSKAPGQYSSGRNTYIVEAGLFTDYYLRVHYGHVYFPDEQDTPQEIIASWVTNSLGYHFNHELGHSIINQQWHSPCECEHLMQGCYNPRKNHLSISQMRRINRTLSRTSNHQYIDCGSLKDGHCDVEVAENTILTTPLNVYGNLIIPSGIEATIKGNLYLSDYSRIIVEEGAKLIVDGGKLTSLCNHWRGIKVYGGNSDFDVKIMNGAIVENTSAAAVSMFAPEPWPTVQQYGNGILHSENSTFNNTKRIVEFMSWSPLPNPSYIRDCVQNGGKWSITNWNCQGIDIRDNVFNAISNECIVTDHGQFSIVGNEFNSGQSDILFNSTSAGLASVIESNQFNGASTGYNARGTTFAQNRIRNNNFQTGRTDVLNDGHNQYDLASNTITATFGAATFDGGGSIADVHNNDFSGNVVGALPIGINTDYNFYENCYSTTNIDNFIDGQVSALIHSNGMAANNCFTHSGNQSVGVQDLGGYPAPFTYLEPQDQVIDCRDGILAHTNVDRVEYGATGNQPDCGSSLQGGGTNTNNWNYCWPERWVKPDVRYAYNWLKQKLTAIDKDLNLSDKQKEWFKRIYKRCFWRVRGYLFEIYLKEGQYSKARELYADESHEDAKVYIYSSYIMENDLPEARVYINSIETNSDQLQDFVTIQKINLNRLPYGPFYEASDAEIETVKAIAMKAHPYAGYGKALYYVLTGEVISSEIPDIERTTEPRIDVSGLESSAQEIKVYPSPFFNNLNIELSGYEAVRVDIMDFFGRVVYSTKTDQSVLNITTDTWHQGVYLIRMESSGKVVFTDKVLLVH